MFVIVLETGLALHQSAEVRNSSSLLAKIWLRLHNDFVWQFTPQDAT